MASEMSLEVAMWKSVLAGTAALAIAGTSLAYAQFQNGSDHVRHWRPSAADMTAFGDARIAALHTGLKLTPDQEKNWPAVETALRDMAKQRSERFAARASADKPKDPVVRMATRATMMTERGASLKKLADAEAPLYQSLDEAQKHRFTILARLGGHHMGHHRAHYGAGAWHHHGPRGADQEPLPQ